MLWLLRLWVAGLMLVFCWALVSYAIRRDAAILARARALWRGSLMAGGALVALWLALRLLR